MTNTIPFKAVAVDMDGTFMRDDSTFDHKRFDCILKQLHEQGAHFIVSSGRPYGRLQKDFAEFLDRIDIIADNGAVLLRNNKIISTQLLTYETVVDFIKFMQKHYPENAMIVTGLKDSYMMASGSTYFKKVMRFHYPNFIETNDLLSEIKPTDQITKIVLNYTDDFSAKLEKEFNENHTEKVHCTSSGFGMMDVVPFGINKGNAIKYFLHYFDIKPNKLITFGDGMNDKEMLELAGYSYAMANGEDGIKKIAKYEAPSNNNDGVLEVLDSYLNPVASEIESA